MSGQRPRKRYPGLDDFLRSAPALIRVDSELASRYDDDMVLPEEWQGLQPLGREPRPDGREAVERIVDYYTGRRYSANPYYEMLAPYMGIDELFRTYGVRESVTLMSAHPMLPLAYAWSIPSPSVLKQLASLIDRPVIEVGAGRGYWAKQLDRLGVEIRATDLAPPGTIANCWATPWKAIPGRDCWYPVSREKGSEAARRHAERILMLCYPPPKLPMAARALEAYLEAGGTTLILIADEGNCGDDDFYELLHREMRQEDFLSGHVVWWTARDTVEIWTAKGR